jgi:uncharacterized membrane protein
VRTANEALLRLEMRLGRLLQTGVISSAVCLAAGLLYWMMRGASPASDTALTVGLILLMATPIVRVLVSLIAYIRMRDWFFVATTVMVFVLLAVTIALALMKPGAA